MRIYFMHTKDIATTDSLWSACMQIKEAELVVIDNNSELTLDATLAIFFGMTLKRPIILHNSPRFSNNNYLFLNHLILKRLNKLVVANLDILDSNDTQSLLTTAGAAQVNYTITRHEAILGRSYLLSRLRNAAA